MKEQQLTRIVNSIAERLVPAGMELWPAIQKHMGENRSPIAGNNPFRRGRLAGGLAAAIVVCFAVGLVAFTPAGRAWAQEVIHFFSHAEADVLPHSPAQLSAIASLEYEETLHPTPYQSETPASGAVYDVSLAEAGQYAGFSLFEPGWLPNTVTFEGASYSPDRNYAWITYLHNLYADPANRGSLLIREEPIKTGQDCQLCTPILVGATDEIESVQIDSITAEFATGTWYGTDKESVWEDTPLVKTLRWQAGGMAFEMIDYGTPDVDTGLTKDELIAIAESLK